MSRLSRAYFPNKGRSEKEPVFYAYMFIRDVHTGIMPYRTGGKYPFNVSLSRKNQSLEKRLIAFLDLGQYRGWSLEESVWEAVETLSHYLSSFGEVYMEIVHEDDKPRKDVTDKKLAILPRGKIIKILGYYIQCVPVSNWERGEKKFYVIPSSRIWHIKLPRKLGSSRKHKKMLKMLNSLSELMPEFVLVDGKMGSSVNYDFSVHRFNKEVAVENATANWGSIRSLSRIKGTTEYYYILNRLKSTRSQATLREHILAELNKLLKRMVVNNQIKIEGLVKPEEITDAIQKLDRGEVGFSEALETIKD